MKRSKGSCQVKKNPRKTRIGQTPPTHHRIQFFIFLETCTTTKNNTKKLFSVFNFFFNLTKPLSNWPILCRKISLLPVITRLSGALIHIL